MNRPICVVHRKAGEMTEYHLYGEADFYVVDENAAHDRVYKLTAQSSPEALLKILGDSVVGHKDDARHEALSHRIKNFLQGKGHLEVVE